MFVRTKIIIIKLTFSSDRIPKCHSRLRSLERERFPISSLVRTSPVLRHRPGPRFQPDTRQSPPDFAANVVVPSDQHLPADLNAAHHRRGDSLLSRLSTGIGNRTFTDHHARHVHHVSGCFKLSSQNCLLKIHRHLAHCLSTGTVFICAQNGHNNQTGHNP